MSQSPRNGIVVENCLVRRNRAAIVSKIAGYQLPSWLKQSMKILVDNIHREEIRFDYFTDLLIVEPNLIFSR
jgi:hypothetical protein